MADGQSLVIANALLKDIYSKGINEQINNETPALSKIKSTASNISNVGGAGVVFSVHFGRNHGIGARNELELLPAAGQQTYERATTGLKSLYGAIQVTGQVMNQAKTEPQAFADVVSEEVTRLKQDLAKDQNRMAYGDGSGTLAVIRTIHGAGATVDVDDTIWIQVGARVDVLTAATLNNVTPTRRNPTAGTFLTVIAVDKVNRTVTFDQSLSATTVGDRIVRSGGTVNSWKKEWTGFAALINNTNELFGINPANHPEWASIVKGSTGTLTELKMNAVVQDIREQGSKPTRIFTTPGCYNAYWNALQSMRQYVNKTELEGGVQGLAFGTPYGNVPMLTDFDAPKGTMWFVNENEVHINTNVGWEWIDEQGSMWQKLPRQDGFVAEMRNYSELTTKRRNAHGRLDGITEA